MKISIAQGALLNLGVKLANIAVEEDPNHQLELIIEDRGERGGLEISITHPLGTDENLKFLAHEAAIVTE